MRMTEAERAIAGYRKMFGPFHCLAAFRDRDGSFWCNHCRDDAPHTFMSRLVDWILTESDPMHCSARPQSEFELVPMEADCIRSWFERERMGNASAPQVRQLAIK
jgi:hypothetical protein